MSCVIKSNGIGVFTTPPAPDAKKSMIAPTPDNIGAANLILPPHIVAMYALRMQELQQVSLS